MARERTRTPATRGKAKPKDASAPPPVEQIHEQVPNGVLILRQIDGEGNVGVQVQRLGDVQVTELATVLKLAEKFVDEQVLGLN